jgi:hypothetical protein
LQIELEETRKKIDRFYRFLTAPKIRKSETGGDLTRAFLRVHAPDELGKYVFCTSKSPSPNHLKYLGFRCPRCNASVVRLKQAIAFGQGYGRMIVQAALLNPCSLPEVLRSRGNAEMAGTTKPARKSWLTHQQENLAGVSLISSLRAEGVAFQRSQAGADTGDPPANKQVSAPPSSGERP